MHAENQPELEMVGKTLIFPGENPGQWAVGTQDNMLALPLKIEGMLRAGIG